MTARGRWPGQVVLRRGLSRAEARPWNDESAEVQLRVIRGGSRFLRGCTDFLLGEGASGVVSPPLQTTAQPMWRRSGYRTLCGLHLWRRDLRVEIAPSDHPVEVMVDLDHDQLLRVDRAAFDAFWRFDRTGLQEALEATPRSVVLVTEDASGTPVGYAVIGVATRHGYLQRLAVLPDRRRTGLGRALVRASLRWARVAGAGTMFLNTQPDNLPAAGLYASEGFHRLPRGLELLRAETTPSVP